MKSAVKKKMQRKINKPKPCYICKDESRTVYKTSKAISSINPIYENRLLCSECRIQIITSSTKSTERE